MGCSASINAITNAQASVENLNSLRGRNQPPCPSATVDFIENIVLVWLIDRPSAELAGYEIHLRRIVSALKIFDNPIVCYEFLQSIQEETIFLIISSKNKAFNKRFGEIPQVYKIYHLDRTHQSNITNKRYRNSQIHIFGNTNILCDLAADRELVEIDSLSVITINTSISNDTSTRRIGAFLITQYMKFLVSRYTFEPNAKSSFADFCRGHYADDSERLREVDIFDRDYRPKEALKWLTMSCFVSRILNRLQRVPDISLLYKIGFMMKHMHMQLLNFHDTMNLLLGNTSSILYRGKTMSQDEFNIFNQDVRGSFLSSAAFLVANTNKNLTIDLLRRIITYRPERIAVLFEIHIDPTRGARVPFALLESTDDNIQLQSDEFCFSIGTIFRIESFEKSDESSTSIWIAKMVMIDDNEPQLSHIIKQVRNDEALENPSFLFAELFMDAGYWDRAAKYFFQLLEDRSIFRKPSRFVHMSCALGDVLMKKNEFEEAVEYYKKGLRGGLKTLKPDHADLIPIYKSLGECYSKMKKYTLALEYYEKAAKLMLTNNIQLIDQETMSNLYTRISEMKRLIEENQ